MIITIPKDKIEEYPNKELIKVEIEIPIEKIEFHGDSFCEISDYVLEQKEKDGYSIIFNG